MSALQTSMEMQMETTMRQHLTLVGIANNKQTNKQTNKPRNKTCWQGCGETGTLCTAGGDVN